MTARRRAPGIEQFLPNDPLADAVALEAAGLADRLGAILGEARQYDQGAGILGYLYRKPQQGMGSLKFEFAERMGVPDDVGQLLEYVQGKYGGGDYRLQIFAGGKTRGNFEFSILGPPKAINPAAPAPAADDPMKGTNLLAVMMNMQAESRRDMMEQQRFAMEQQGRRDAQLMQTLAVVVPVLAPLMFGGREKMSEVIAMMNANRPAQASLKEQVETLSLLKGVVGGEEKGETFNPDDLVGSIGRFAGPLIGAAGRAFGSARGGAPGEGEGAAPQALELPPPQQLAPPVLGAPAAPPAATTRPLPPLLAMVAPDVHYMFTRRLPPDLAADAIVDILQRAGVTDEDVNELVAAFLVSPDWKVDLANGGLDLRGDAEWADAFLAELVPAWSERDRDGDRGARAAGGGTDADDDAAAGAGGLALDADPGPGA